MRRFLIFPMLFFMLPVFCQCDSTYFRYTASGILDIHLFDTSRMIAIGDNGDIINTADGGQTWKKYPSFSGNTDFKSLSFPSQTTGYAVGLNLDSAIYKTEDAGISWFPVSIPFWVLYRVHFLNNNEGFIIGGDGHLFSTGNGGRSWTDSRFSSEQLTTIAFTPNNTSLIGGKDRFMIRSTDKWQTWNYVNLNFLPPLTNIWCIKFVNDLVGFATTDDSNILKTIDGGITWTETNLTGSASDIYVYDQNIIFFVNGNRIKKTIDGGQTWVTPDITYPGYYTSFYKIAADPQKKKIVLVGSGGGNSSMSEGRKIISTTDLGNTWTSQSGNYGFDHYAIQFLNDSVGYMTGQFGIVFKTKDRGESWIQLNPGFPYPNFTNYSIFFIDSLRGYVLNDTLYYTNDGGFNWNKVNKPPGVNLSPFIHFLSVQVGFYSTAQAIYKTTDGGANWQQVFNTTSYFTSAGVFFSGSKGYVVGYNGLAYQSADSGNTWTPMNLSTNKTLTGVYFYNDSIGFIGTNDSLIYKTTNAGVSWTGLPTGILNIYFSLFRFVSDSAGYMMITLGATQKVYGTKDGGRSWFFLKQPFWQVNAIAGFNTVYFTGGSGMFLKSEKLTKPGIPGYIVGRDSSCINETTSYLIPRAGGVSYSWLLTGGGTHSPVANKDTVNWNAAGIHNLSVTTNNVCGQSPIRTLPITIIQYQSAISQISDTVLRASPGINYQWYKNDIEVPSIQGGTAQSLVVHTSAIYKVKVTNNTGCTAISAPFSYFVTAINDPRLSSELYVYPTITSGELTLEIRNNSAGEVQIDIISSLGQQVKYYRKTKSQNIFIIDLNIQDLAAGVYYLRIQYKNRQTTKKIIKQ